MTEFELVQVHEGGKYAEVVIRDKNGCKVYAGNIPLADNPKSYYPPDQDWPVEGRHKHLLDFYQRNNYAQIVDIMEGQIKRLQDEVLQYKPPPKHERPTRMA